jgi:cytoskeletal protein CcmA (bactofilin family)
VEKFMRARVVSILIGFILLASALPALAVDIVQGDQCLIESNAVIEGDLFVFCRALQIDGTIRGNLFGAATTMILNGTVQGSIYALAGRADVYGSVGRDLHMITASTSIHSSSRWLDARSTVYSVSLNTNIDAASIPGSVSALGYQLISGGSIGGDLRFTGTALDLSGSVSGQVDAVVGSEVSDAVRLLLPLIIDRDPLRPGLRVRANIEIGGILTYAAPEEGDFAVDLGDRVVFNRIAPQPEIVIVDNEDAARQLLGYLSQTARELALLIAVGALLLAFMPRLLSSWVDETRAHIPRTTIIGTGGFLIALPIWLLIGAVGIALGGGLSLIGLTAFGISTALLAFILAVGGTSAFYFTAAFVARAVACLVIGALLLSPSSGRGIRFDSRRMWLQLLVGAVTVALLVSLPIVGWIINLLTVFLGVGALISVFSERRRAVLIYYPPTVMPVDTEAAPPPIEDLTSPPGMDDLPPGFNWWR